MSIDLDGDLSVVDGAEPVTYVQISPAGEYSIDVTGALRRAATQAEISLLAPGVALGASDLVWHLPANAIVGITPRSGDRILAGSETWLVVASEKASLGTRWRLYCRLAR